MENKNGHLTLSNLMIIFFLFKLPKKDLINILPKILISRNIKSKEKEKERKINQIKYINKISNEHLLINDLITNKIIYVEPIICWKKYGLKTNAHSLVLLNKRNWKFYFSILVF